MAVYILFLPIIREIATYEMFSLQLSMVYVVLRHSLRLMLMAQRNSEGLRFLMNGDCTKMAPHLTSLLFTMTYCLSIPIHSRIVHVARWYDDVYELPSFGRQSSMISWAWYTSLLRGRVILSLSSREIHTRAQICFLFNGLQSMNNSWRMTNPST